MIRSLLEYIKPIRGVEMQLTVRNWAAYRVHASNKIKAAWGWSTHIFSFYDTFHRHFRTQIAPEKNKNFFK